MVHHLSVLPQQRASELEYEDRVRVECVQGREGRALPMVDWCLILASGFRVSESPTEPWRGTPSCPHAPGRTSVLVRGGGCLSLPLIHQMLAERLLVAVPGRGMVRGSEGIQARRERAVQRKQGLEILCSLLLWLYFEKVIHAWKTISELYKRL